MELEPVDKERCQTLKPNGHSFMTMGGVPGLTRCKNSPIVIAVEAKEDSEGVRGSMSMCEECLEVARKELPSSFFDIVTIVTPSNQQETKKK